MLYIIIGILTVLVIRFYILFKKYEKKNNDLFKRLRNTNNWYLKESNELMRIKESKVTFPRKGVIGSLYVDDQLDIRKEYVL